MTLLREFGAFLRVHPQWFVVPVMVTLLVGLLALVE